MGELLSVLPTPFISNQFALTALNQPPQTTSLPPQPPQQHNRQPSLDQSLVGLPPLDYSAVTLPSSSPKRFPCPSCNKCFASAGDIKRHVMTHTGEKPYRCSFCSYKAIRKADVTRHMLSKHAEYHQTDLSINWIVNSQTGKS